VVSVRYSSSADVAVAFRSGAVARGDAAAELSR
jgi:hypothetical protein